MKPESLEHKVVHAFKLRTGLSLLRHALEGGTIELSGLGSVEVEFLERYSKPPSTIVSPVGLWELHVFCVRLYLPVPVFVTRITQKSFTIFKPLPGKSYVSYFAFGEGGLLG